MTKKLTPQQINDMLSQTREQKFRFITDKRIEFYNRLSYIQSVKLKKNPIYKLNNYRNKTKKTWILKMPNSKLIYLRNCAKDINFIKKHFNLKFNIQRKNIWSILMNRLKKTIENSSIKKYEGYKLDKM